MVGMKKLALGGGGKVDIEISNRRNMNDISGHIRRIRKG